MLKNSRPVAAQPLRLFIAHVCTSGDTVVDVHEVSSIESTLVNVDSVNGK